MLTKEIKKGDRVQMRNGWYGTILDNKTSTIRMAEIEGTFTDFMSGEKITFTKNQTLTFKPWEYKILLAE
jgi:hypothetical protein